MEQVYRKRFEKRPLHERHSHFLNTRQILSKLHAKLEKVITKK